MRVAAFDCGTNSLRLLIADVDEQGQMTELRRETRIVRLGQESTQRVSSPPKRSSARLPRPESSPRWPPSTHRRN